MNKYREEDAGGDTRAIKEPMDDKRVYEIRKKRKKRKITKQHHTAVQQQQWHIPQGSQHESQVVGIGHDTEWRSTDSITVVVVQQ